MCDVSQPAAQDCGSRAGPVGSRPRRSERRNLGESCSEAAQRLDAARRIAPSRPGRYATVSDALESALDAAAARAPNPGRPSVHRLNRAEYANAVRDLLGVEHRSAHFFACRRLGIRIRQHRRRALGLAGPARSLLVAAGKIARLAVGDPSIRPRVAKYRVPLYYAQEDRTAKTCHSGRAAVSPCATISPPDGEYVVKVVLQRTCGDIIRGIGKPRRLEVRLDRARVKEFTLGGPGRGMAPAQQGLSRDGDADLEVRFPAKPARAWSRRRSSRSPRSPRACSSRVRRSPASRMPDKIDMEPAIDTIEIHGPYNATSANRQSEPWQNIFVCRPASAREEAAVRASHPVGPGSPRVSTSGRRRRRRRR